MFTKNTEFYRESLFINTEINPNILMSAYTSMFQNYFNKLYPIIGKNKNLNKQTNWYFKRFSSYDWLYRNTWTKRRIFNEYY